MSATAKILMPLEQEGAKSVVRAWLKKIGEAVRRDEPIVELETDKVAVEVPSPADGLLLEITLNEGDEAPPGATLGVLSIGAADPNRRLPAGSSEPRTSQEAPAGRRRSNLRLSPLVKRLLSEHTLSPDVIAGSGSDGRITHKDVERYISTAPRTRQSRDPGSSEETNAGAPGVASSMGPGSALRIKSGARPGNAQRIAHDPMRKSIAEHMSRSLQTAPHVTALFEADFSAIAAHRAKHKAEYEKNGAPLTYSAYVVLACAQAMKAAPNVNSRWHDDALEVFEDANIGIGVALGDRGLIVPVIARAQSLCLREIAAKLGELTAKARNNRLKPADVQGGTFTISNHGVSGSLLATPIIINQPQSAILGIGKLEKRVVVREVNGADAIQVRPMAYVSLTIDHRVLDGHQTNAWLTHFVETLEAWPLEDEI